MDCLLLEPLKLCHRFLSTKVSKLHTTRVLLRNVPQMTLNPFNSQVSEVIDVRTEKEFFEDHIPGAKNLPVLSQAEHVQVGIQYSKDSFKARKTGAKFVSSNISHHIDKYFQNKDESYSPLVYCWRGGQRSQSLAIVLAEIGFSVFVLEGGYKTYRQMVRQQLEDLPQHLNFKVLSGLTGTGKTYLLRQMSERGQQVLDLEGLARHKGSLLGLEYKQVQPSQKYWESMLRERLAEFDPSRPVWVESESQSVGKVKIPQTLFKRICDGKRYNVTIPMSERVNHIIQDYPHWISDTESLKSVLAPLEKYQGRKKIEYWFDLIAQNRFQDFVESLLRDHYDPTYSKSQTKAFSSCNVEYFQLDNLQKNSVDQFLNQILVCE